MPRRPRYRVLWTHAATRDLESLIDFIAPSNVNAAMQVLEKIRKAAASLQSMPERGRIVPELAEFGLRIYREILSPPWRIIYRIAEPKVSVMAIIDSRRNVEDILLDRLIR